MKRRGFLQRLLGVPAAVVAAPAIAKALGSLPQPQAVEVPAATVKATEAELQFHPGIGGLSYEWELSCSNGEFQPRMSQTHPAYIVAEQRKK